MKRSLERTNATANETATAPAKAENAAVAGARQAPPESARSFLSSLRPHVFALSLMVVLALVAAGCGQAPAEEPAEPEDVVLETPPAEEPGPEPAPPAPKPYRFPLTGIGTDEEPKSRPIAVLVENSPRARPQDGLHKADLVYEILAEGDITRFVAVYQSREADVIGPVRSLRPYFAEIGHGLDALIVHAGWSQEAINYVRKHKLANFDQVYGDDKYYWRDKSRKAPHNLYTKTELIRQGAADKKYREEWNAVSLLFHPEDQPVPAPEGLPARSVKVNYIAGYYVGYEYDEATGRYRRLMLGEPHVDKTSGEQLMADNILVLYAKHRIVDDVGRRKVNVTGPGEGWLIQKGVMRSVTWERKDGLIRPYIDGEEVPLVPGQTWIQIIPEGSKVEAE